MATGTEGVATGTFFFFMSLGFATGTGTTRSCGPLAPADHSRAETGPVEFGPVSTFEMAAHPGIIGLLGVISLVDVW